MNRARAMGDYLRFTSVLPPRLSEFAIIITARQWTQNYEWDVHAPLAQQGGLKPSDRRGDRRRAAARAAWRKTRTCSTRSATSCIATRASATRPMRAR